MGRGSRKNQSTLKIDYDHEKYSSTASFVERVNFMTKNLHAILERRDKNITVLLGPAGMGKSTMVRKYAKLYRKNYFHVIFVQAHSFETMSRDFMGVLDRFEELQKKSPDSRRSSSKKSRPNSMRNSTHNAPPVPSRSQSRGSLTSKLMKFTSQEKESRRQTMKKIMTNLYTKLVNHPPPLEGQNPLPTLIIFDNAHKLGHLTDKIDESESEMLDGIFDFLPNFNLHKNAVQILVTSKDGGEFKWAENFCRQIHLEPFTEIETIELFFDTLKFALATNHKNRKLAIKLYKWTLGHPIDLQRELRYKSLVLRYRTKILKELKEPETIGRALWATKLMETDQLKQLCKLRVREHKNLALFDVLQKTSVTQVDQIVNCLGQQTCQKLKQLFILIVQRVSNDLPWNLHDAASERNISHLSALTLSDQLDEEKFWIKDGQTPLHLAVIGEDSKKALKFVIALVEQVASCVDLKTKVPRDFTAWDVIQELKREKLDIEKLAREKLIGTMVTTYYNKRTYKVTDLDFDMTPMSTFYHRTANKDVTYIDYYKDQYKVKIKDKGQPLLLGRITRSFTGGFPSRPCHLIPELCNIGQVEKTSSTTWFSKQWPMTQSFLDHQDHEGMTALHLAAQHESVEIVKWLYDQQANILIENNVGVTPLDLMYEKAPAAVAYILDKALPLCEDHSTKGNLEFDVDFLAVLGYVEDDDDESCGFLPITNSGSKNGYQGTEKAESCHQTCFCCHSVTIEPPTGTCQEAENLNEVDGTKFMFTKEPSFDKLTIDEREEIPAFFTTKTRECRFRNSGNFKSGRIPREMSILANMVLRSFEGSSKTILSHVIVKSFLELKWRKLIWPIRIWTLFYIILHFWFTWFIISVFIVSFPHGDRTRTSGKFEKMINSTQNLNLIPVPRTSMGVWEYLIGVWDSPESDVVEIDSWSPYHHLQAMAFLCFGIILILIELYEFFLIAKLTMTRQLVQNGEFEGSSKSKSLKMASFDVGKKLGICLSVYLSNLENVFQLIFIFLMMSVSTVVFQNSITSFYYEGAAVSVVIAWTLILLQFGNFYAMGKYVQIFKTVLRSFFIVMGVYLVLVLAFCISFSILFNKKQLFITLPTSFFRALSMMAGELNYESIFETEDDPEGPEHLTFPFAKQLLHASFTVIVTVILINLLIGLTVSDIEKIRGKSDVIFRSIQVERLYIMENFMIHFISWFTDINFMYVVPLSSNDMVIRQAIKNLPPRLQREIRKLLAHNEDRAHRDTVDT